MTERIRLRRIYEASDPGDGMRILVDGLWPRGLSKADAKVDLWLREIAPSAHLRRWFAHDPGRWETFRERYRMELGEQPDVLCRLLGHCRAGVVTLLYASRDTRRNQALVLREVLEDELREEARVNEPASPVCYRTADDEPESP